GPRVSVETLAPAGSDTGVGSEAAISPESSLLRKRAEETSEQESPTPPAHLEGSGALPAGSSEKEGRAVGQRPAISDQISNAVIARTETLHRWGRTEIHLRLEPPELGQVRLHLSAMADRVSCRVVVREEAARQALETQLPLLRDRLSEAGIALGRFEISWEGA